MLFTLVKISTALGAITAFFGIVRWACKKLQRAREKRLNSLNRVLDIVKRQQVEIRKLQLSSSRSTRSVQKKVQHKIPLVVGKLNQCVTKYVAKYTILYRKMVSVIMIMNNAFSDGDYSIDVLLNDMDRELNKLIEYIQKSIKRME